MEADLIKNTEFRIGWPRGEMGALPADAQQDLLLEFMASQVESMQEQMESMMRNSVNIKRAQQDIERLLNDVEKLKDNLRESNGSNYRICHVYIREHERSGAPNDTVRANGITILMHEGSKIAQEKRNRLHKGRILWTSSC